MSSILGRAAESHIDIETAFNGWRSWTILKDLSFFSTVKNWVQYDNWDVSYFLYCICSLSMLMISLVLDKGNLRGLINSSHVIIQVVLSIEGSLFWVSKGNHIFSLLQNMDQQVHLALSKESLWHTSNYLCYSFLQESSEVVKGLKTSWINGQRVHFSDFNRLVCGDQGLWVICGYREYFLGHRLVLSSHNWSSEAVGNVLSFVLVMASSQ